MPTKKINNASSHLKVKSLEVIKGGDSKVISQLKTLWVQQYFAKADRESLRTSLESLSLDAKITPAEKVFLQTEWTKIAADHAVILQDAEQYELTETDTYSLYVAAFNALSAYITPILTVPEEETTILQVQYNTLFDTYFSTFSGLSTLIIYSQISGEVPSYEEIINGFDYGTGGEATATPTTPTLTGEPIVGGVRLTVDKQDNLKFLKEYHFQVSDGDGNWYALGMDGQDWKTGGAGGYTSYPGESFMHNNLPPVQLEILGTWTSGSDVIAVPLGTGQLADGDLIAGAGIPEGATIAEIVSLTSIRISAAATASGTSLALLIGDDIAGTGENKKYMGIRLYYRSRRVTAAGVMSAWSSLVFLQAGQMQPGYIAAHSILMNHLVANIIEAGFAVVNFGATIGYAGIGSVGAPVEGDRRIYLDGDEIIFQTYISGEWNGDNGIKIGGVDPLGNFFRIVRSSGIVNQQYTESEAIPTPIPSAADFWNFNSGLLSKKGVAIEPDSSCVIVYENGVYGQAVTSTGAGTTAYMDINDLSEDHTSQTPFYWGAWIRIESGGYGILDLLSLMGSGYNIINVRLESYSGGTDLFLQALSDNGYEESNHIEVDYSQFVYIGLSYEPDGNGDITATLQVGRETATISYTPYTNETVTNLRLLGEITYGLHVAYDDMIYCQGEVLSSSTIASYLRDNQPWESAYRSVDVSLKPYYGGRIFLDGPVRALGMENHILASGTHNVNVANYSNDDLPMMLRYTGASNYSYLYLFSDDETMDIPHKDFRVYAQSERLFIYNRSETGAHSGGGPDIILEAGQCILFGFDGQEYFIKSDGFYKVWDGSTYPRLVSIDDCGGFAGEYKIVSKRSGYTNITFIDIYDKQQRSLSTPWDGTGYAV